MASKPEQSVSRSLRMVVADLPNGAGISASEQVQDFFDGLRYFLPEVLVSIYPEWIHEELDGFLPVVVRKSGEGEIEFVGFCILIADQAVTPIHLHIQASNCGDEVSWLECRIGEKGEHGMVRTPWPSTDAVGKLLHALEGRASTIEWVYKVTFGQRQP